MSSREAHDTRTLAYISGPLQAAIDLEQARRFYELLATVCRRCGCEAYLPHQRLTAIEALEGYTTHAARAVEDQAVAGRIAPGFRGDLTAFADDPVECDADDLPQLPVVLTVVDGRVVHRG